MSIKVKKITYTPANIIAMFATPQVALEAPEAGYVNNILGVSHDMVYDSAPYTGATQINYGTTEGGVNLVFYDNRSLPATDDVNLPLSKIDAIRTLFSTTKDFKAQTDGLAAGGDSDITAYIVYETKQIDA